MEEVKLASLCILQHFSILFINNNKISFGSIKESATEQINPNSSLSQDHYRSLCWKEIRNKTKKYYKNSDQFLYS